MLGSQALSGRAKVVTILGTFRAEWPSSLVAAIPPPQPADVALAK
jgi:hypothetical protein